MGHAAAHYAEEGRFAPYGAARPLAGRFGALLFVPARRRGPEGPRPRSAREGGHLSGCGLPADARAGRLRRFVGLPVLAGDVRVGGNSALGRSQKGECLETHLGSEEACPGGLVLETGGTAAVFITVVVGEAGGDIAGLRDLLAVELSGATGGADERRNDALKVDLHRLLVEVVHQRIGRADGVLLDGFPDRSGIDGLEAEGPGEVFGERLMRAERRGVFEREESGAARSGGRWLSGASSGSWPLLWILRCPGAAAGPVPVRPRVRSGEAGHRRAGAKACPAALLGTGSEPRTATRGPLPARAWRAWREPTFCARPPPGPDRTRPRESRTGRSRGRAPRRTETAHARDQIELSPRPARHAILAIPNGTPRPGVHPRSLPSQYGLGATRPALVPDATNEQTAGAAPSAMTGNREEGHVRPRAALGGWWAPD